MAPRGGPNQARCCDWTHRARWEMRCRPCGGDVAPAFFGRQWSTSLCRAIPISHPTLSIAVPARTAATTARKVSAVRSSASAASPQRATTQPCRTLTPSADAQDVIRPSTRQNSAFASVNRAARKRDIVSWTASHRAANRGRELPPPFADVIDLREAGTVAAVGVVRVSRPQYALSGLNSGRTMMRSDRARAQ